MRDFNPKSQTEGAKGEVFFRFMAAASEAIKEAHKPREEESDWTPEDDEAEEDA